MTRLCIADALVQICKKSYISDPDIPLAPLNHSIYETLKAIAPDLSQIIPEVTWNLQKESFLEPIFTREGVCYTLNSISSHEIYSDEYV